MAYTKQDFADSFEHAGDSLAGAVELLAAIASKTEPMSADELQLIASALPEFRKQVALLRSIAAGIRAEKS